MEQFGHGSTADGHRAGHSGEGRGTGTSAAPPHRWEAILAWAGLGKASVAIGSLSWIAKDTGMKDRGLSPVTAKLERSFKHQKDFGPL